MNFDYNNFITNVNREWVCCDETQRYGQFLMNYLCSYNGDVYDSVPEELDPFYDNSRVYAFLGYLAGLN